MYEVISASEIAEGRAATSEESKDNSGNEIEIRIDLVPSLRRYV